MSEGRLVALLCSAILECLVFGIGEFKLMLCDWLTVLYAHVQSRFHIFLMICKRGVGHLPFNFCCLEFRMRDTFGLRVGYSKIAWTVFGLVAFSVLQCKDLLVYVHCLFCLALLTCLPLWL